MYSVENEGSAGGWKREKKGKKSIYTAVAAVSIPIIPFPYSLERGPVLEEAFILWLFVLSRERSAIFPPPPLARACAPRSSEPRTATAAVKTKMKNSPRPFAAKTIFYPLAWPSFAPLARHPSSLPSPRSNRYRQSSLLLPPFFVHRWCWPGGASKTTSSRTLKPLAAAAKAFFSHLFYFIVLLAASLKNQFDAVRIKYRALRTNIAKVHTCRYNLLLPPLPIYI